MLTNSKSQKVLFICDKWCAGNKKFGLSEWDKNMQNSLESTGLADFTVFHLDDYYIQTGKKGDEALLQKIAEYRPDMIYFIAYKVPDSASNVPNFSTLEKIKNDFKIPIAALIGDLALCYGKLEKNHVAISKTLLPYTTLIVTTELTAALERIGMPDRYVHMWIPKDPRVFNNPNKERNIDISYVGSPKKDRTERIMYLFNHNINVLHGGGERQEHLTTEQYADRYQRSKISLSFSRAAASHVINARPFEAMLCGAMLLEQESFELMKLYTPYVDYVPYSSKRDMLKKAQYYLSHDEERERIARSGQEKTERLYNAKRFWQIVIDRALGNHSGEEYKFEYAIPAESLARLSPFTAFKMKFLNSLCSTNVGFTVYRMFNRLYWQEVKYSILDLIKPFLHKILPKKVFEFILKIKRKIIYSR